MIVDYRGMASDKVRVDAFRRAIELVVKPDDVVVDLGCGLGTYAIFACRAGARKVYAIEREAVIITAKQIANDNDCGDRIEFIRDDALAAELPERADVVITEDFSSTFVQPETERLVAAARRRFLKKGGRFVPAAVTVYAAPVNCPKLYTRIDQWGDAGGCAYGVDFSETRQMAMNCVHRASFRSSQLLGQPKKAHEVDFGAATAFAFNTSLRFRARKASTIHGVAVWFEAQLAPRVRLSNAPGAPATLWGQSFLPLAEPVRARKGPLITVALAMRSSRASDRAWWQWEVQASEGQADGNTFRSFPASIAELEAGARPHRPGLSEDGQITACVLQGLQEGCTIQQVGQALQRSFPSRFPILGEALSRAGACALKYGRRPKV